MTKPIATPVAARPFQPWQRTECDNCGGEFQVTRTREKTYPAGKPVICEGCENYQQGYADGYAGRMKEEAKDDE